MDLLIDFNDIKAGTKTLKKLAQAFTRAGAPVASTDIDPRTKRTSGVNYRQALVNFTDSQKVVLSVKTTGDIFEVKVNGSALPIKAQDDQRKAIGEIVKALDAGRAKFQAKMARQKVVLPKGIKTAAVRMEQQIAQTNTDLDGLIATAKARVNELRTELGEPVLDGTDQMLDAASRLSRFIGKQAKDEDGKVLGKVTGIREEGPKVLVEVDGKRIIVARNAVPSTDVDKGGAEHLEIIGFYTTMVLDATNHADGDGEAKTGPILIEDSQDGNGDLRAKGANTNPQAKTPPPDDPDDQHSDVAKIQEATEQGDPKTATKPEPGRSLDAVDVPTVSLDCSEVRDSLDIVKRMKAGDVLDDGGHALATLKIALDVVETNMPINLAEGNLEQADLEERAAEDFREAITALEAKAAA